MTSLALQEQDAPETGARGVFVTPSLPVAIQHSVAPKIGIRVNVYNDMACINLSLLHFFEADV